MFACYTQKEEEAAATFHITINDSFHTISRVEVAVCDMYCLSTLLQTAAAAGLMIY